MGQIKRYGARPHVVAGVHRFRALSPRQRDEVRVIARQQVDVVLDEIAEQALEALGRHDG